MPIKRKEVQEDRRARNSILAFAGTVNADKKDQAKKTLTDPKEIEIVSEPGFIEKTNKLLSELVQGGIKLSFNSNNNELNAQALSSK